MSLLFFIEFMISIILETYSTYIIECNATIIYNGEYLGARMYYYNDGDITSLGIMRKRGASDPTSLQYNLKSMVQTEGGSGMSLNLQNLSLQVNTLGYSGVGQYEVMFKITKVNPIL